MRPTSPALLVATTLALTLCGCAGRSETSSSCLIGSQALSVGTKNPANECQSCQPVLSRNSWSPSASGLPCADGGTCSMGLCQRGCFIAGTFYPEGTLDSDLACQSCQPDVAADRFCPLTGSAPAGQCEPDQVCSGGVCETACFINGQVVAIGQSDPANPCGTCVPAARLDGYTPAGDGILCNDGGFRCVAGSCLAGCVIGGLVVPPGELSPGNPCLVCDPRTSFLTWQPLSGPSPDGGCGAGQVCGGGACRTGCIIDGGFLSSMASDPADGCLVCDPTQATTIWTAFSGVPESGCAGGQVCDRGSCRAGCLIDGGLIPDHAYRHDEVSSCCNTQAHITGWTNTFGPPLFSFEADGTEFLVSDFDRDGLPDLLFGFGIALGQGNGTFLPLATNGGLFPISGAAGQFVLGDFNHDGWTDLAFIDGDGLGVQLSGGWDAGFGSEELLPVFHPPTAIFAADINGDGATDLISFESIAPGYFPEVFLAIGDGGFGTAKPILGNREPTIDITTADFNGDGVLDLAIIFTTPNPSANEVLVLTGQGNGTFAAPTTLMGLTGNPVALATGDFDGDGKVDLVIATSLDLDFVSGDGQGGFSRPLSIALIAGSRILVADFNGDGSPDLIVLSPPNTLLLGNRGDGTFDPPASVGPSPVFSAAAADVNGDGALDLVFVSPNDGSSVTVELGGCR